MVRLGTFDPAASGDRLEGVGDGAPRRSNEFRIVFASLF